MKVCKLLIITDTYVGIPGGSERHLYNFLSNLSFLFEARALQLNATGNPYFKDQCELKENVHLYSYPLESIKSIRAIKCLFWVYKQVLEFKPDIVISYHEKSDLINLLIDHFPQTSFKTVSSKRDMGLHLSGIVGRMMKRFNKSYNAITAPSKSIIDLVQAEFNGNEKQTHVIPNGLLLSDYSQATENRNSLKAHLGLPLDKKIIITVGWLRQGKGHEYLIKAMAKIQAGHDCYLVLLGRGNDQTRLETLCREMGIADRVLFAGMQTNVNQWLSVSDVAVSASLSEGLSNALVEAAASQLPIVATDVGGNPEVVENGFNGYLVESQSSDSLADALSSILGDSDRMHLMGINSRNKAEKEFSIENMVASLESLYLRIQGSHCEK